MKDDKTEFSPYIPDHAQPRELTWVAVITGAVLSIVFGAANAYLGLKIGMTISASIPAAVISMVVIRVLLRRNSILENNMVQTIASAGESIAAGVIFTVPAFFLWEKEGAAPAPSLNAITVMALFGGILGVLFMIPVRHHLIVAEHHNLVFPEGRACAKILLSAENKETAGNGIFWGIGLGALIKILVDGLKLCACSIALPCRKMFTELNITPYPAMIGVGYICGLRVSATLFAGGLLSWFVFIPLIVFFGGDSIQFPGKLPISEIYSQDGASGIWSHYIRYIGAGGVAAGGLFGLLKTLGIIAASFGKRGKKTDAPVKTAKRTEKDLSAKIIIGGTAVIVLLSLVMRQIPMNWLGVLLFTVLGFFFALVSARIVGVIGSSNSPCSGMTIAALLVATFILKRTGVTGTTGMLIAMSVATMVCIINCISNDVAQDLKTGFLLGATPWKQQVGEIIGVIFSAVCIGGVVLLLNKAWTFGSAELPSPQASLMKLITEGVMQNNVPWLLIFAGGVCAIVFECVGLSSLCVAIGIFLPIETTATVFAGGLVSALVRHRKLNEEKGILFSSGLVAGEGLAGILLALFAVLEIDRYIAADRYLNLGAAGSGVLLLLTVLAIVLSCRHGRH